VAYQIYGNYLPWTTGMKPTPLCGLSGAAMLTSLAYLSLPHPESDIPGHTGPKPLELKTPNHPSSFCMSLPMGVPDQLLLQSKRTEYPLSFTAIDAGC